MDNHRSSKIRSWPLSMLTMALGVLMGAVALPPALAEAPAGKDAATSGKDATTSGKDATASGKDATASGKDQTNVGKNTAAAGKNTAAAGKNANAIGTTGKNGPAHVEDEIDAKLKLARMAAIDKKYKEALDLYLWIFEHSRNQQKWQGMRNALVSLELVRLAEVYEPAKEEVLKLRDGREGLVVENKANCADVQDWCILNHNLKDDRHSVSVYKQLSAKGEVTDKECDWIEDCIPVPLVRAKEYKELLPWAERAAAAHIATVEDSEKKGFSGRLALPLVMEEVYASYEVLLADGKEADAGRLSEVILRPWSSHDMFSAFVRAARRTGHTQIADELLAQAKKRVSATDYELILGELR